MKAGGKHLTFNTPAEIIYPEEKINLNKELCKKFIISLELLASIRLQLSADYAAVMQHQPEGNGLYVLCQLCEDYLQRLQKEDLEEYFSCLIAHVAQTKCHLLLTDCIAGDAK